MAERSVKEVKPEGIKEKKKAGRPSKKALTAVKNKNNGVLGRPKGDTAIINEYKQRMLNSPKSARVLEAIYDAALNDDHKNQAAAWKLIMDRVLPVSVFEQVKQGGGTPAISINIMGLNQASAIVEQDDVEVDIQDVESKYD